MIDHSNRSRGGVQALPVWSTSRVNLIRPKFPGCEADYAHLFRLTGAGEIDPPALGSIVDASAK